MALFSCQVHSFSLANFVHATKESRHMEALRLHTLPKWQFDLDKVAYNITTAVKLKQYNHEDNDFEDLLQWEEFFEQSFEWEKVNLKLVYFQSFQEFKNEGSKWSWCIC